MNNSSAPQKFLIIQTASIGDVILATPLIEKLHALHPEAAIDFLLKKGNESLFDRHPFIRNLWIWDKSNGKLRNLFHLIPLIRREKYDWVVNCQRFASTGLITVFSGAKVKTGFSKNPFSILFTYRYVHRFDGIYEVQRNLQLISHLGGDNNYLPRLYPTPAHFAKVSQFKTRAFITLSPASLWFTKQYPADRWIEFLRQVPHDMMVVLLGSQADHGLCEDIARRSQHPLALNLAGKLNLLESAALIKDAIMNYVNDSAPMHLASAMNAPTAAVFCSTVPSFGFGPLSEKSYIIETTHKLRCRPCGIHGLQACPEGHFHCAFTIETQDLLLCLKK